MIVLGFTAIQLLKYLNKHYADPKILLIVPVIIIKMRFDTKILPQVILEFFNFLPLHPVNADIDHVHFVVSAYIKFTHNFSDTIKYLYPILV